MKNFIKLFNSIFFSAIIFSSSALANEHQNETIIIDAEIQDVVEKIADPIFKAASIKTPKIYIIQEDKPNAFTTGGENVFITSSLISMFPDPNILRGVIAHEVGHITARHVSKTHTKMEKHKSGILASILLSTIALTAVTQGANIDPSEIIVPSLSISQHISERSLLKFSRQNETEADIKANKLLTKAGFNSSGLLKLLEYFHDQDFHRHNRNSESSVYDMTHPLSNDRINLLKSYNNTTNFTEDPNLIFEYKMASAKLNAYVNKSPNISKLDDDEKHYAMSIIQNKKLDKEKAIHEIDYLIKKYPHYPFFYLQKAEILTNFGDKESIGLYAKSLSLNQNDIVKIEQAIAKIILFNSMQEIKTAISTLEINLVKFQNNITIVKFLSLAHDKIGNKANSLYYRALQELLVGKIKLAKKIALSAKMHASNNNELLVKIEDIIQFEP